MFRGDEVPGAGIASLVVRRRRAVLIACLVLVIGLAAFIPRFLGTVQSVSYNLPGSESAQALEDFGSHAGFVERDLLVVSAERPPVDRATLARALQTVATAIRAQDGVADVVLPTADGGTAAALAPARGSGYATVLISDRVDDRQKLAEHLQEVADEAQPAGFRADVTGTSPILADLIHVEESDLLAGETLGIPVALLILFFACGSLVAAFLPIGVATAGLLACLGVLGVTSYLTDWGAFVESIVAMLGLGLGIDYTLLMVRRFRDERAVAGATPELAMARTITTAGRTVAFSGATVMVCLPSFLLLGEPLFAQMAIAGMIVVGLMVVLAVTLVPALLLTLGDRIDRVPAPRRTPRTGPGPWAAWAQRVMRRPWTFAIVTVLLLGAAAVPSFRATLGVDYGVRALQDEPSGRALSTVQQAFPATTFAPVDVAITGGTATQRATAAITARRVLGADDRVTGVQAIPSGPQARLLVAAPTVAVDDPQSERLVDDLRERFAGLGPGVDVRVGGAAAEARDYSRRMTDAAPMVIAATLGLSFLLLVWAFRSLVIPLKALLANLLSVGAAYGLLVLVFQDGGGEQLLGFTSPGYLQSWMPLTLFVFIFGLSMDYEVFLVSRMREEWLRTHDNRAAIVHGLDRTGGVVTSAATIMVAVFAAFMLTATVPEIKQFAFGLGVAVLIDATIVRAMLVPAVMRLAGRWNWWLPAWLDRLLPGAPSH